MSDTEEAPGGGSPVADAAAGAGQGGASGRDAGPPASDAGSPSTDGGASPAEDPPSSNGPTTNGDAGPSTDPSGGAASTPADPSGASSSGDEGSDTARAGSSGEATDEHHDWVTATLGVDPRTYDTCDPADTTDGQDVNATPAVQAAVREQSDGAGGNPTGVGTGTSDGSPATPDSGGGAAGAPSGTSDGSGAGAGTGGDTPSPADQVPDPVDSADDKKERTKDAIHKLMFAKDEDMQKMSPEDKAKYVQDLLASGAPTATVRDIQKRLYKNTDITPEQQATDDASSDKVAADLAGDQDLQHARANWGSLSDADKAAALKKVVDAQSNAMGVPAPEIVVDNGMKEGDDTASGVYNHEDGKLHINMDPDSNTADFQKALSIAAHENTHHYQDVMMQRLKDGTLKPSDPEYAQTKLFAANNGPNGYIEPHEGIDNYKNQPLERHAWGNGDKTAQKIVDGM